jgi:DNA modification methylase
MDNLSAMKNIDTVVDTHDVEQNISMFEPFLTNAFRLVKQNGYVVFWYDLDHHEKLQTIATAVGFKVQRWPIIWHKLHPCKNASPRINFTKNYEVAMVLRKSVATALVEPQTSSIFACDGQADRKLYDNPFAKPLHAWKSILSAVAYKGQTIFDPFAGQMSCGRACINMGMIPMGIEIDPNHYNKGIMQLTKLIKEING